MDLNKERKIKFWLATISKVLIIILVLFKLWDVMFNTAIPDTPEKKIPTERPIETNGQDSLLTATGITTEQLDSSPAIEEENQLKIKYSKNVPIKKKYAELELVKTSFIWLKEKGAAEIKISNLTENRATQVNVNALLNYAGNIKNKIFSGNNTIAAKEELSLKISLQDLPENKLPDAISLCINYISDGLDEKKWHNYILDNTVSASGPIELRSIVYTIRSHKTDTYSNNTPNCPTPSIKNKLIPVSTNTLQIKNPEPVENIKSVAKLFVTGLNNKSLITLKNTTSSRLYAHIISGEHKNYNYGFESIVQVISRTENDAILQFSLTREGRNNYIRQASVSQKDSLLQEPDILFDFLERKGSKWLGKAVKKSGIWKIDLYQ